jgi:hypothetical protein
VDFLDCTDRFSHLVLERKSIVNSFARFGLLPIHDGRIERMELVIFYLLVDNWFDDLFWV